MIAAAHPHAPTRVVDPLLGRAIGGRFVLLERIGGGATGAVYRAVQRSVGRDVAVKIIDTRSTGDPALLNRFLREARLVGQIAHPNVMEVIDAGVAEDGLLYLVSGYLAGRTVSDAVAGEGAFELDRVVRIGVQLCDALEAAHARGIVHGDLRATKVMLLPDDSVVVLDFGVSLGLGADPSGDLSALGVILRELASGRQPLEAPPPQLPRPLAELIHALFSADPSRRPERAREVKAALLAMVNPPPEPADEVTGIIQRSRSLGGRTRALPPSLPRRTRVGLQLLCGATIGLGVGYALAVLAIRAFGLG